MLTAKQIRAQVEALLERAPDARAFALNVSSAWTGPGELAIRERPFRIVASDSELALREALVSADASGVPVVLLTKLSDGQLGEDLCARLARRRVNPLSGSEMLRHLFQAKDVEPRLRNQLWLAEALVDAQPAGGYPPVPGGRLDEETALESFLRHVMGFTAGRPDLTDVLEWSRREDAPRRLAALSPEASRRFEEWASRSAGGGVGLVLASLRTEPRTSAIALALASGLVFQKETGHEVVAARGRLERYFGGRTPEEAEATQLESAALRFLDRLPNPESARPELEAFDQLLKALRLEAQAIRSDCSPIGLEQRYGALATRLQSFTLRPEPGALGALDKDLHRLRAHRLAGLAGDRRTRAEMAVRLCRWLAAPVAENSVGLGSHAARYREEGAFVDWARHALFHGDQLVELSKAYGEILRAVLAVRESQNAAFARALVEATRSGVSDGLGSVEEIVPVLVAPLATLTKRVLFLVVDGLSLPVFQELSGSMESLGFSPLAARSTTASRVALAGLPTVTEWSRRLLLGGREAASGSQGERTIFGDHPALARFAGPKAPQLFLKGDLTQTGDVGFSESVREALHSPSAVVGVVINAVDDHLLKGDQLHIPWTLDRIPLLHQLLTTAGQAERVVVLTADHGHVVENDSRTEKHAGGDRYRHDEAPAGESELEVRGGRVAPFAKGRFIAPGAEQLGDASKKKDYHGGCTPQGVLVPVMVLAQEHFMPDGWRILADPVPSWWLESPDPGRRSSPPKVEAPQPAAVHGLPLFAVPVTRKPVEDWVDALFATDLFRRQHQLAGRVAPAPEVVRRTLLALDDRSGALLVGALAGKVGLPEFRMAGLLTGLRRVLNVEGYPVLTVDEASATVRLNRELLDTQFDLVKR